MDRADLFSIYALGANVRPLLAVQDNITIGDFFLPMLNAQGALNQLLGPTPQAKIEICQGEARRLVESLAKIEKAFFYDDAGQWRWPENANQALGVYSAMQVMHQRITIVILQLLKVE